MVANYCGLLLFVVARVLRRRAEHSSDLRPGDKFSYSTLHGAFGFFRLWFCRFFCCGCSVATFFVEGGTEVGWGLCLFCLVEKVWNASLLVVAFPTKAWLKRKSSNSVLNVDARSLDCITHTQPVGKLHVRGAASRKAHI